MSWLLLLPTSHLRCRASPKGTPGPTNATVAINVAFDDLGYAGEDGITESIARDSDKKKAFGGATVRILQTNYDNTFKFVLMEHKSAKVLKRVFGASNVIEDGLGNITVRKNKKTLPVESWIFDTADGDDLERVWVPEGQVSEVGDIVRVHTDTIAYELTVESFESALIDGDNSRTFMYVDALAPSGS